MTLKTNNIQNNNAVVIFLKWCALAGKHWKSIQKVKSAQTRLENSMPKICITVILQYKKSTLEMFTLKRDWGTDFKNSYKLKQVY